MHNFQDYHVIQGMFHIEMYNDSKAMYLLLTSNVYMCFVIIASGNLHGDYIYLYIHLCPLRLKYD